MSEEKIIVEIRWTKTGDEEPNQRLVKLTQDLPVVKTNEVADLLLQLPRRLDSEGRARPPRWEGKEVHFHYYHDFPQSMDAEPDFNQLARAIADLKKQTLAENAQILREIEKTKKKREARERKERQQAEQKQAEQKQLLLELAPKLTAALDADDHAYLRKRVSRGGVNWAIAGSDREHARKFLSADLVRRIDDWAHWENDRPKREKAEREERRKKYIADWAQKHGSKRLKKQVEQGFAGWPLYLHEKVEHDFGGIIENRKVVLDNNDSYEGEIDNPNLEYLEIGELVLQRIKKLEQELTIEYCRYRCDGNQDQYDAISIEDYRPGPKDAFEKTYNLRLRVSDYRSWLDEE